jgi:hypothetical protein
LAKSELRIENEELRRQNPFLNSQFFILNFAAALLLIGHFAPWAAHKTAALTLSAHDLAVFTNFTPGAGIFLNEWFYLPLWSAAILLAMFAAMRGWLARILIGLISLAIASLGFPTYPQVLDAFGDPNYQLQFFITLAVMLSVVAIVAIGSRPRVRSIFPYLTAMIAVICAAPLIGYLIVKPFIEELYRDQVGIGLGWWLTLAGDLLLFCVAGATILQSFTLRRSRR